MEKANGKGDEKGEPKRGAVDFEGVLDWRARPLSGHNISISGRLILHIRGRIRLKRRLLRNSYKFALFFTKARIIRL